MQRTDNDRILNYSTPRRDGAGRRLLECIFVGVLAILFSAAALVLIVASVSLATLGISRFDKVEALGSLLSAPILLFFGVFCLLLSASCWRSLRDRATGSSPPD